MTRARDQPSFREFCPVLFCQRDAENVRVIADITLLAVVCEVAALYGQGTPSADEQDRALAAIREYALNYSKSLPDYICTRVTQQKSSLVISMYAMNPEFSGQHPDNVPSWTADIKEELTVAGQQESYKVLKISDNFPRHLKPAEEAFGTIPVREFGAALDRIFAAETGASFHWVRSGKVRDRPVMLFSFDVQRAHGVHVYDNAVRQDIVAGYKGLVYADAESKAVLRIETHSSDFPSESEFRAIDLTLDYKAVKIGEREFVLPYRFALEWHRHKPGTLGKARTLPQESSVEAEYKDYRGYSAKSGVTYGAADSQSDVRSSISFGEVASPEKK
jgi:hypothetical protein